MCSRMDWNTRTISSVVHTAAHHHH
jgi:hypothetical protein